MRELSPPLANARIAGPAAGGAERYGRIVIGIVIAFVAMLFSLLLRAGEVPFLTIIASIAIVSVALVPAYLWADGTVRGLPILPLHVLALIWTYAYPLVSEHPGVTLYDPEDHFLAGGTVILYAVVATAVWWFVSRLSMRPRTHYLILASGRGFALMIITLIAASVFLSSVVGNWFELDAGLFGIVRSGVLALTSVSLFVLGYRLGQGSLNLPQRTLFIFFAAYYIVMQLATLFLVGSVVSLASVLIGFIVGRRGIPWTVLILSSMVFVVLHLGKASMREDYWGESAKPVTLRQLPGYFAQWIEYGLAEMAQPETERTSQPIFERVSLAHLLLRVQRDTPDRIPFLMGESYEMIPELLVPRIFWPEKASSHEGTTRLNVHYGIQAREDSERTTIGWGLLNEAWANFGFPGVVALACFIGGLFGFVGRLTVGAPAMSLQVFVGATFAAIALQTEFTMGVFVTVLFQSLVMVMAIVPFLTRQPVSPGA